MTEFGVHSEVGKLRKVMVHRPELSLQRLTPSNHDELLFDDVLWVERAQYEHDRFVEVVASLGPTVHVLDAETDSPDLVYTFDPLLVTDRGAVPLRPGKLNRRGEPGVLEAWTSAAGIPTVGCIEEPGTVEGGDTFWLRPDLFCIGRTLRTNDAGARQLADIVATSGGPLT